MMKTSMVKPISYFKAHAAQMLHDLVDTREPIAITQNGEVRVVVQDAGSFERTQETLALLKRRMEVSRCYILSLVF